MKYLTPMGYNNEYRKLFESLGCRAEDGQPDFLLFTGGADVSPRLYGDEDLGLSITSDKRDHHECVLFNKYKDIPKVGICRGGQFLNVMSGGAMYQDVKGHCGAHEATVLDTGQTIFVTSTHHQMMIPSSDGRVLMVAHQDGHKVETDLTKERDKTPDVDTEVVFYPHTNCLCFQPHPEFTRWERSLMITYFRVLFNKLMKGSL